jgi:alanyl-tRNA synthetase
VKAADIRRAFLDFYAARDHRIIQSASLIPEDPTLLLTVAGMVPFKPYFLGEKPVEFARAASCQKCVRTNDIENVGRTARHMTLFEMLGNFSFGDYYKKDAIRWAWELSTQVLGFDPKRIWVTVFETDDEAYEIWRDEVGIAEDKIVRRGAEDNFWWMGVAGPGGPCSELFFDRRPDGQCDTFDDGDGLMEFYNLVFTESEVDDSGNVIGALDKKNVDTGMGLDRVAVLLQGVDSVYDADHLRSLVDLAARLAGKRYGVDEKTDISVRIMAEHARAAAFMIGDGILPSNEGRGYVLRRLLRRAVRHARIQGVSEPVMSTIADAVIDQMGDVYPELVQGREFIKQVVHGEEEGFLSTLRQGMSLLESDISKSKGSLAGATVFKLHDTYGFPLELTSEIAAEAGLEVDQAGFEQLMQEQRDRARAARETASARGDAGYREVLAAKGASLFTGYDHTKDEGTIAGLISAGERVGAAREGDEIEIVLDRSPFYPEGGGQVGDRGAIESASGKLEVTDTIRVLGDLIVHRARVVAGEIAEGQSAQAIVDEDWRTATERSHTATHVVHATLRQQLGEHARQAGSLVEPGRLRFDFAHFEKVPRSVLDDVEALVNERILQDSLVAPFETSMEEARRLGAMMLFEEKYGDIVRVVEIGDYSIELCGGIHATRTSQVGAVKLLGEASIGSNLRRIEGLTGREAIAGFRSNAAVLEHIASLLKTSPQDAPARVEKLLSDLKQAEQELRKQAMSGAAEQAATLATSAIELGSTKVVVAAVNDADAGMLQQLAIGVRDKLGESGIVVLAGASGERASIVCAISGAIKSRGLAPSALIKEAAAAIGGGAGGKDLLATGGGKNIAGVDQALAKAKDAIEAALNGSK